MPDLLGEAMLLAALPYAIVFVVVALAVAVLAWALRRARRGPRAQARAADKLRQAGDRLVALDEQLAELDLSAGPAPATTTVRRVRMTAGHARDELYGEFRSAVADDLRPLDRAHAADRVTGRATTVLESLARAQSEHRHHLAEIAPAARVAAARDRADALRARMGDPTALVRDLRARFDESESSSAAIGADEAVRAAEEVESRIDAAEVRIAQGGDADWRGVDRALRRGDRAFRVVDESYRLVIQSAAAVEGEIAAVRATAQQALRLHERLDPVRDVPLRDRIDRAQARVDALGPGASRRPTETVIAVARLQEHVDDLLAGTRTAQQGTRAARLALAGTLAAARVQLAHAEASALRAESDATTRAAVWKAEQQLGAARGATDPMSALAAARNALQAADEAAAGAAGEPL